MIGTHALSVKVTIVFIIIALECERHLKAYI